LHDTVITRCITTNAGTVLQFLVMWLSETFSSSLRCILCYTATRTVESKACSSDLLCEIPYQVAAARFGLWTWKWSCSSAYLLIAGEHSLLNACSAAGVGGTAFVCLVEQCMHDCSPSQALV